MKSVDLSQVYKEHKGQWVALSESYIVISADKSAKKTLEEAVKRGYPHPTLFKVPKENNAFIG